MLKIKFFRIFIIQLIIFFCLSELLFYILVEFGLFGILPPGLSKIDYQNFKKPNNITGWGDLNEDSYRKKSKIYSNDCFYAFGDSFTYGYGLDYNSSIAGIISRKTNYSVINLAVPGYGPSMSKFHLNKSKHCNVKKRQYKDLQFLQTTSIHFYLQPRLLQQNL